MPLPANRKTRLMFEARQQHNRRSANCSSIRIAMLVSLTLAAVAVPTRSAWSQYEIDEPPINYQSAPLDDPIARLQKRLAAGQAKLKYDRRHGYLASVLKELGIQQSSQVLVFSKTSFQRSRISPRTPRTIYFNDNMYVGWVQRGDVVEISAVDPKQGGVFYALKQNEVKYPRFVRMTDRCTLCHASSQTKGVPGHLVRSVYPSASGMPYFGAGTFRIDHSSPIEKRWGGWYVSGTHGKMRHMGNVIAYDRENPENLDTDAGANITDLSKLFDTKPYLTPHSDIVALMVLEHQVDMHNYLTLANYQARFALRDEKVLNKLLDRPSNRHSESTQRRFNNAGEKLLKYMLFSQEAKLTAPIRGTSSFTKDFEALGPHDRKGRSLRDFDLQMRLFKYPCSYLIYSESFDNIPTPVKDYVYRRLWEILTGQDDHEEFAHLCKQDRRAILEILRDTKKDLPDYWTSDANGG